MNRSHTVSASSSLIDAKLEEHQIMSSSKQCPSCGHNLHMKPDWLGLPAGVKFDPTDQELMEHLEAKVSIHCLRSHPLIDEFIPTIDGEDGICYTHPEKLPGVTRDGLSKHFFHRPSKAYTTGTRKRRKIQLTESDVQRGETRWHKTGKTRPVMVNGRQKGCKKILVLYTNFGKHRKPEKTNWVMHQYHLGEMEEEKEGELVVSKIFYQTQPRQCGGGADAAAGGSCSSTSKHRDELSSAAATAAAGMPVYSGMDQLQQHHHHHMNQPADNFSFAPFRKSFDEVGIGVTSAREASIGNEEQEEHDHHQQQQQHAAAAAAASAAFHISRPTNPISAIISPSSIHQTSMVLDDPFHVSRMLLQGDKFHEQQQQEQKLVGRSAGAGLEELIMGCTSNNERKAQETSIPHPPETEWLKYSYWSPDSHDHHGS